MMGAGWKKADRGWWWWTIRLWVPRITNNEKWMMDDEAWPDACSFQALPLSSLITRIALGIYWSKMYHPSCIRRHSPLVVLSSSSSSVRCGDKQKDLETHRGSVAIPHMNHFSGRIILIFKCGARVISFYHLCECDPPTVSDSYDILIVHWFLHWLSIFKNRTKVQGIVENRLNATRTARGTVVIGPRKI